VTKRDRRSFLAWERAAGPFWQYLAAFPFRCAIHRPIAVDSERGRALFERLIAPHIPADGRRALLADLPIDRGLELALPLRAEGWLVVPVVYRWPAPSCLLPVEGIAARLAWLAQRLPPVRDAVGVAFLLDAERSGPRLASPLEAFDNRYSYPADVLPPPEAFREWGAAGVVQVGASQSLPPDLAAYVDRLAAGGLATTRVWVPDEALAPRAAPDEGSR
jgi:hypothetical protein